MTQERGLAEQRGGGGTLVATQADRAIEQQRAAVAFPTGRVKPIFHAGPEDAPAGGEGLAAESQSGGIGGGDANGGGRSGGIDLNRRAFDPGHRTAVAGGLGRQNVGELLQPGAASGGIGVLG